MQGKSHPRQKNQATGTGPDVAFMNLLASFPHPFSPGSISSHHLIHGYEAKPLESLNLPQGLY